MSGARTWLRPGRTGLGKKAGVFAGAQSESKRTPARSGCVRRAFGISMRRASRWCARSRTAEPRLPGWWPPRRSAGRRAAPSASARTRTVWQPTSAALARFRPARAGGPIATASSCARYKAARDCLRNLRRDAGHGGSTRTQTSSSTCQSSPSRSSSRALPLGAAN